MKLSIQHLNTYFVKDYSVDDLTTAIEKSGIEVEGLITKEPLNTKIVVGLTKKVVQHPNADKLRLVLVDVGAEQNLHIVCGAPNAREDIKVAVATVGSILPDGTEIREATLRGELSQGMLCGEAELGWIPDDGTRNIAELPEDYEIGKSLCDIVQSDVIVDIKSAANRFDLQSYEGVAREIAAQLGVGLILPNASIEVKANPRLLKKSDKRTLAFSATSMDISQIGTTSAEVGRVLDAAGVRQISPVVDVTNYINLTVGQPLHAFAADKITLPLYIRAANRGEKIKTLNGKTNTLTVDDLVVADAHGPVDIAGVMGGADTEVSADTKEIVLIASTIHAMSIRKTAQRHGIRTDASARYERGLPVELLDRGRSLAVQMLVDMGAKLIDGTRLGAVESPKITIEVKPEKINSLLGVRIEPKQMIKHLNALGIDVSGLAKLKVRVPWWRPDIKTSADVAEEVIKMVGLDNLPATIPAWSPKNIEFDRDRAVTARVRELLRASGLFELTTYSFVSQDDLERFNLQPTHHLKLKNPLSIEQAYLRSSLLPSLIKVLENNQRYSKHFGVSEISRVFIPGKKGQLPAESYRVGVATFGDYFAAKAPLGTLARELRLDLDFKPSKHAHYFPGRQADVLLGGAVIGSIGEVHPNLVKQIKGSRAVSYLEVELQPLITATDSHVYTPMSRFPGISRDVALVMNNKLLWQEVATYIKQQFPAVAVGFQSRYEGAGIPDGQMSLAFRVIMTSMERTLTDAEADDQVAQIVASLTKKFKATPRS